MIALTGLGLAPAAHTAEAPTAQPAPARPNIVLVISDDVGLDVTSNMVPGLVDEMARLYGPQGLKHHDHEVIRGRPASTPNLDRLAREGITFASTWAQPFCSPTRASILTGLFAGKANVINYADPLSQHHTSFVQRLKDEGGYSTGLFGKWHLAGLPSPQNPYPGMKPKEAGFEVFRGNLHAAIKSFWDYDYMVQDESTPAGEWRTEKPPVKSLPGIAPTSYAPVVKVADALEWIRGREAADPARPWFVWLAFNLSHATTVQQPSAMAVPNADTLDEKSLAEMKACGGRFGTNEPGGCRGEALMRAMTNSLDTVLGKFLDELKSIDSNTVVIYIGDNGTPMYGRPNLDFIDNLYITRKGRGKGSAYESGVRVPLVIAGPGIAPGRVSNEFTHAADLFPTILALAGVTPPAEVSNGDGTGTMRVDGRSLLPIVSGRAERVRDPARDLLLTESLNLMTNNTRQVAARNGVFKVICTEAVTRQSCEFYNLERDPLEEFPLPVPENCPGENQSGQPAWHYCMLAEAIRTQSFFVRGR
jgi:arylsulfatase A-like enzyme